MTGPAAHEARQARLADLAAALDGKVSWPHVSELRRDEDGEIGWTFESDEAEFVSLAAPRIVNRMLDDLAASRAQLEQMQDAVVWAAREFGSVSRSKMPYTREEATYAEQRMLAALAATADPEEPRA